ncbi:MAG: DNA-directed RNA polymerase subunit L [Nanoarchaeota archaeon]
MEVKILEEKKNRIVFVVEGDTHTCTNALRAELNSDEHVKAAGYHLEHPLLGQPQFVVETDGANPRKTVAGALKRLGKLAEKLAGEAESELK